MELLGDGGKYVGKQIDMDSAKVGKSTSFSLEEMAGDQNPVGSKLSTKPPLCFCLDNICASHPQAFLLFPL